MDAKAVSKLGIRYVKEGPPELVRTLNDIINGLDRLYPETSTDISAAVTAQGTTLKLRGRPANPAKAATSDFVPNFMIRDASGGGVSKVLVEVGQVNGMIPTIGGTSIGAGTPPTITLTADTRWSIYLRFEVDPTDWSDVGVIIDAIATEAAWVALIGTTDDTYSYQRLGICASDGAGVISGISQFCQFSLEHDRVAKYRGDWWAI